MPKVKTKKIRQRKEPKYKSFKLTKKLRPAKPLVGPIKLTRQTFELIFHNKKIFLGLTVLGGLLGFLLTLGSGASVNFSDLKQTTQELLGQDKQTIGSNLILLTQLIGTPSSSSGQVVGVYQSMLWLVLSLATIYGVRSVVSQEKISLRDTFYNGMYPIIPFVFVFIIISIQLIPFGVGSFLLSTVVLGGLAVNALEVTFWLILISGLTLLSAYMVLSSLMALYIVTLPDMVPMKALRSARGLVINRRLAILSRLIVLAVVISLVIAVIILPFIYVLPSLVELVFYLVLSFCLVFAHGYVYSLYRSLL